MRMNDDGEKEMNAENDKHKALIRSLYTLAFVNAILWILSMIALIVIMQKSSSPKGIFVILAVGLAVGVTIVYSLKRA